MTNDFPDPVIVPIIHHLPYPGPSEESQRYIDALSHMNGYGIQVNPYSAPSMTTQQVNEIVEEKLNSFYNSVEEMINEKFEMHYVDAQKVKKIILWLNSFPDFGSHEDRHMVEDEKYDHDESSSLAVVLMDSTIKYQKNEKGEILPSLPNERELVAINNIARNLPDWVKNEVKMSESGSTMPEGFEIKSVPKPGEVKFISSQDYVTEDTVHKIINDRMLELANKIPTRHLKIDPIDSGEELCDELARDSLVERLLNPVFNVSSDSAILDQKSAIGVMKEAAEEIQNLHAEILRLRFDV